MDNKRNILFLDFDGVLNSIRSLFKKYADHHNFKWTDNDFSLKWYGKGHPEHCAPGFIAKLDKAVTAEKLKPGYKYPNLSMHNWPPEEDAIKYLNQIVEENDADVVICSTWRNHFTIEELQEILNGWGAKCKVIGVTTNLRSDVMTRGREILNWVMENRNSIKGICILDDDAEYDINGIFEKWAVQGISGNKHGLRKPHVILAKKCFDTPIRPLYDFDKWVSETMLKEARENDAQLD